MQTHVPVMMQEVLDFLPLKPGAWVADGTLGLAGHSLEISKRITPGGMVIATDWDQEMLAVARERLSAVKGVELSLHHADYRSLPEIISHCVAEKGCRSGVDGVLLDLGLNNAQIEDADRGISFKSDGPLDMRMDRSKGKPLSEHLLKMSVETMEEVLREYGGENWAKRIAQVICDRRKVAPITTTFELVDCVMAAVPARMRDKGKHPATRTFQAFRIYVNSELDELEERLVEIGKQLSSNGVMVVLSYHSGEDRAVKFAFKSLASSKEFRMMTKKPLEPTPKEVAENPKSRSAKLRAIQRIGEGA